MPRKHFKNEERTKWYKMLDFHLKINIFHSSLINMKLVVLHGDSKISFYDGLKEVFHTHFTSCTISLALGWINIEFLARSSFLVPSFMGFQASKHGKFRWQKALKVNFVENCERKEEMLFHFLYFFLLSSFVRSFIPLPPTKTHQ
jgi:hypothetical protein